jgi:HEAT repeat protein
VRFVPLSVVASLVPVVVLAADARVILLSKQLGATKDPRVRAQTVLLLGQTASAEAVEPLCGALKDPESIVRAAAANALGDLKQDSAMACLMAALGEPDPSVRAAMERALAGAAAPTPTSTAPAGQHGGLYFNVEPIADKVGGLDGALLTLTDTLLRKKLTDLGATFAPSGEARQAAQALIKKQNLRGFQVRVQLAPGTSEKQLKVEMLIMTYPEQALQGSWNVKASGAKPETLIKAMVPKVVDDAAGDLNWKSP